MAEPVDLVLITGTGRSGSTLLENLLAREPGVVAVGELHYIWQRGFIENHLCSCGTPFRSCEFWRAVFEHTTGGLDSVDAPAVAARARQLARTRHAPLLRSPRLRPARFSVELAQHTELLGRLFASIAAVSGAGTIVDSSKDARYGFVLTTAPGIRMRTVHLVRDSRAVAYSWQRTRRRPEIHWDDAHMPRYSAGRAAWMWTHANIMASLLRRSAGGSVRLRYEDVVAEAPDTASIPFVHSVSGNPSRFDDVGGVPLTIDDEWRTALSRRDFALVTAITAPMLRAYGYRLSRR